MEVSIKVHLSVNSGYLIDRIQEDNTMAGAEAMVAAEQAVPEGAAGGGEILGLVLPLLILVVIGYFVAKFISNRRRN